MFIAEDDGRIRRAHPDGMSIREMARRFQHARQKIRQILRETGQNGVPIGHDDRRRIPCWAVSTSGFGDPETGRGRSAEAASYR